MVYKSTLLFLLVDLTSFLKNIGFLILFYFVLLLQASVIAMDLYSLFHF